MYERREPGKDWEPIEGVPDRIRLELDCYRNLHGTNRLTVIVDDIEYRRKPEQE